MTVDHRNIFQSFILMFVQHHVCGIDIYQKLIRVYDAYLWQLFDVLVYIDTLFAWLIFICCCDHDIIYIYIDQLSMVAKEWIAILKECHKDADYKIEHAEFKWHLPAKRYIYINIRLLIGIRWINVRSIQITFKCWGRWSRTWWYSIQFLILMSIKICPTYIMMEWYSIKQVHCWFCLCFVIHLLVMMNIKRNTLVVHENLLESLHWKYT